VSDRQIELPRGGLGDGLVRIRPLADADIPAMIAACDDPEIKRYTQVPSPYAAADARAWWRRSLESQAAGNGIEAVIADSGSDAFLGTIGIRRHAVDHARWAIGYLVAPQARNRGVATAATRLICRFGFERLGAQRIELTAEPQNEASLRVAARTGFKREGLLRSYQQVRRVRRDMVMHSLIREDMARS
jgi:RimJ/RimL family protein N-acetyltransferase